MKTVKYTSYALMAMFGLFAYWQANDPDGVWWLALYLVAAVISFFAYRTVAGRWTARAFCVATAVGGFWLLPDSLANWIEMEEAREGFGLLICALVTGALSLTPATLTASPE